MDRIEYRPYAKIITHSTYEGASKEDELITIECQFWRFILPEINTHRVLSRNYQSSRAVPVEKLIEQVRNNPAIPVHWGKNQRGMVADEEISESVKLCEIWEETGDLVQSNTPPSFAWGIAADNAARVAEAFHKAGYHKQVVNRLLEPFMWTRGVITATRGAWESVFALRCHKDAQPEFQALAYKMKEAIESSEAQILKVGEWHLPYVTCDRNALNRNAKQEYFNSPEAEVFEEYTLKEAIKVSTSCCAQVSYRALDNSLEKALKIYDMLNLPEGGVFKEAPAHMSPCEHQACVMSEFDIHRWPGYNNLRGNFGTLEYNCWAQHRKILETGLEKQFIK